MTEEKKVKKGILDYLYSIIKSVSCFLWRKLQLPQWQLREGIFPLFRTLPGARR